MIFRFYGNFRYFVHILSLLTDNNPSWWRRMTIEIISNYDQSPWKYGTGPWSPIIRLQMCIWLNFGLCLSCWCIFVWTILSQTPQQSPQVMYDASWISAWIFWLSLKEPRTLRRQDYQGRLSIHFLKVNDRYCHSQAEKKTLSWKNWQMLEFCLFTWSWMGPIKAA